MNQHDRDNLDFLLSANKDTLKEWYDAVEEDDIEYAGEILAQYGEELKIRESMIPDDVNNLDDANTLLKRYRL